MGLRISATHVANSNEDIPPKFNSCREFIRNLQALRRDRIAHMTSNEKSAVANWPAPFRGKKPVDVRVVIPGSKSVTNRALILAAQAVGTSKLRLQMKFILCVMMKIIIANFQPLPGE